MGSLLQCWGEGGSRMSRTSISWAVLCLYNKRHARQFLVRGNEFKLRVDSTRGLEYST